MLSIERQTKLDPILKALKEIPGIRQVWQDDFDSNSILVHLELQFVDNRQFKLVHSLQSINRKIKKAVPTLINISVPQKTRSYNGKDCFGKPIYLDQGYDSSFITVDMRLV